MEEDTNSNHFRFGWKDKVIDFPSFQASFPASDGTLQITRNFSKSSWKLGEKVHERSIQYSEEDYQAKKWSSEAEGLFECISQQDGTKRLMLIFMQIPFAKSELFPVAERRKQASKGRLGALSANQVKSLQTLHLQACTSCPQLVTYKDDTQGDSDPVPGGYILYTVMEELPGVPLSEDSFWKLLRTERDDIRRAFKAAYIEILNMGVENYECDASKLSWSKQNAKIYITSFQHSELTTDSKWSNDEWVTWGLMDPPGTWHAENLKRGDAMMINNEEWRV